MRILGVVDYLTTERGMIALSLATCRLWFQRDGATYLEVHVANPKDAPAALTQLEKIAAAKGLFAYSGQDAVATREGGGRPDGIPGSFRSMPIVALLAAMALFNAFMISVIERASGNRVYDAPWGRPGSTSPGRSWSSQAASRCSAAFWGC